MRKEEYERRGRKGEMEAGKKLRGMEEGNKTLGKKREEKNVLRMLKKEVEKKVGRRGRRIRNMKR